MRELYVKNLENVNYDPEKSYKNIIIYHDKNLDNFNTYRDFIKDFKEKEGLTGRFNIDTNDDRNATKVLSSFVVSATSDFYKSLNSRDEMIDYYKNAFEFIKQEYPTAHFLDYRVHFDEKGLPHAQGSFIPVYEKENGDRVLNITAQQKGKDYFRGFQDRYYNYMREKYPDKNLQRINPSRDHIKKMDVKEYKEFKETQKEYIRKIESLKERVKDIDKLDNYFNKVDEYCYREGLTFYQYQKDLFYADRGLKEYPPPEKYNPDRSIEIEHNKNIDRDISRDR